MSPGPWQIVILVFVFLLLFGAKRIPQMMGSLGQGVVAFKKGINGIEDDDKKEKKSSVSDDEESSES
jgi:sec-independent protein translocase protein TatA